MGTARWLTVALVLVGAPAAAVADREAEAEQLFVQGKALMREGRHADACAKFAASHELSPRASTLMNLGACQQANQQLATAWATFKAAASLASRTDPELATVSRERSQQLEATVSTLTIRVPAASRVHGLEVTRDGTVVVVAQWDSPIFVDGGEYEIVARAPGTEAWRTTVAIAAELDRREIEIPQLTAAAAPATEVTTHDGPAGRRPDTFTTAGRRPGMFTPLRIGGVATGVAGIAALSAGVVLGLRAQGLQDDSEAICPTTTCDDPRGLELNRDARATGTRATILFVTGGVAVAGGVTLWLLGKPRARERVALMPWLGDRAGVTLAGWF